VTLQARRGNGDQGSVTAEFAVALPAVVAVLAVVLSAVAAATAELRCVDAARAGARAAARGENTSAAVAAARAAGPAGASVRLQRAGGQVRVEVRGRVSLLGPIGGGHLAVPVGAVERAPLEPGLTAAGGP
jgi:Flp pilus assembly protein TadG